MFAQQEKKTNLNTTQRVARSRTKNIEIFSRWLKLATAPPRLPLKSSLRNLYYFRPLCKLPLHSRLLQDVWTYIPWSTSCDCIYFPQVSAKYLKRIYKIFSEISAKRARLSKLRGKFIRSHSKPFSVSFSNIWAVFFSFCYVLLRFLHKDHK